MSGDRQTDTLALADILSDPAIREIWEQELWEAFADENVRRRFTAETGVDLEAVYADPLDAMDQEAAKQVDAGVLAFMEWFNERCWVTE